MRHAACRYLLESGQLHRGPNHSVCCMSVGLVAFPVAVLSRLRLGVDTVIDAFLHESEFYAKHHPSFVAGSFLR